MLPDLRSPRLHSTEPLAARFPAPCRLSCRNLLHSCHISVGLCYTLLNAMQCGDITLEVAHRHVGHLSEAGVRLTAAFTALGSLIRPPKHKRRRFARLKNLARRRAAAAADGEAQAEVSPALATAAAAGGAATLGSAVSRPHSKARDIEGAGEVHEAGDEEDDPFAELGGSGGGWALGSAGQQPLESAALSMRVSLHPITQAAQCAAACALCALPRWLCRKQLLTCGGGAPAPPPLAAFPTSLLTRFQSVSPLLAPPADDEPLPVVALSESQLMSAQQMARHLSSMRRHASGDSDGGRGAADAGAAATEYDAPAAALAKLSPLAEAAGADGGDAVGGGGLGNSPGAGAEQRRDWALAKLAALVGAVEQLEAAALRERKAHPDAGAPWRFASLCEELLACPAAFLVARFYECRQITWGKSSSARREITAGLPCTLLCRGPSRLHLHRARPHQPHPPGWRLPHCPGPAAGGSPTWLLPGGAAAVPDDAVTGAGETAKEVCQTSFKVLRLWVPARAAARTTSCAHIDRASLHGSFLVVVVRKRLLSKDRHGVREWAAAWGGQKGGTRCAAPSPLDESPLLHGANDRKSVLCKKPCQVCGGYTPWRSSVLQLVQAVQ